MLPQVLWLADNYLTSISGISQLTQLQQLNVARNDISMISSSLSANTALTSIILADNRISSFQVRVQPRHAVHPEQTQDTCCAIIARRCLVAPVAASDFKACHLMLPAVGAGCGSSGQTASTAGAVPGTPMLGKLPCGRAVQLPNMCAACAASAHQAGYLAAS